VAVADGIEGTGIKGDAGHGFRLPRRACPCKPGRFPENPVKDMDCFNGPGEPDGDLARLLWERRRHLCFARD
jgi:hypothetical protein